jgi:hypothetical protein
MTASLGVVTLALLVAHIGNRLTVNSSALDLNEEHSLATWFTAVLLFAAAASAAMAASYDAARRGAWITIGLIFVGLSIDDIVGIHERLEGGANDTRWILAGWVLSLLLVGVLSLRALLALPRPTARSVAAVLALLALAQAVALAASYYGPGMTYEALAFVEESLEVLAAVLGAVALVPHALRATTP